MSETELVERLERLERSNRRLKGFVLVVLLLVTALVTVYATQPVPQKITAHEFDVVDNSGRERVRMDMLLGEPHITFLSAQGKTRMAMSVDPSGALAILLSDAQGKVRAAMAVDQSGQPFILFRNEQGKVRAGMAVDPSGQPFILLSDAQGNTRAEMLVDPSGVPNLTLSDPQGFEMDLGSTGTVSAKAGATGKTSAASIIMFGNDEKHQVIWQAP